MRLKTTLLAAAAAISFSAAASAAQISGSYLFTVGQVSFDTVNSGDASAIYFTGGGATATPANTISNFTPSFTAPTGLTACGNCGTINNITGIPQTASGSFAGTSPLFTIEGLTFNLTSLVAVSRVDSPAGSGLTLIGLGTYTYSGPGGYTSTNGNIQITVNNNSMQVMTGDLSASGSATPSAVPEPASLALLGGGLAVVGMIRRRRRG